MKTGLWNKNFTLSFFGTIISAFGSIGLGLGLSVFVYSETESTLLSAIFATLSMIPQFVLPLIIGTYIDRKHPVKVMVKNEVILSFLFLGAGIYLYFFGFNYIFLVLFNFITSSLGVVSQLCSGSILPKLMEVKNFNRGNSIMNMIYPLCAVAGTPLFMWLIGKVGVPILFIICGICSFLDAYLESHIDVTFNFESTPREQSALMTFKQDLSAGLTYVAQTPSIRSIFLFFVFVMMMNSVKEVLLYPYFYDATGYGNQAYASLLSVTSIGYLAGGMLLYLFTVSYQKRFRISMLIFIFFIFAEGFMFMLPLPLLFITQFLAGVLGAQSANFRISAILAMVPEKYLGKVNALFNVMVSLSIFLSKGMIGYLGLYLPYATIALIFAGIQSLALIFIFLPPKNHVKEIYNYKSAESV